MKKTIPCRVVGDYYEGLAIGEKPRNSSLPAPLQVDSGRKVPVSPEDSAVLAAVERYLSAGRVLKAWYEKALAANQFRDRFEIARAFNRPDTSFGFFDSVSVDGKTIPVMGNCQEMFFDQPGAMADFSRNHGREWLAQVREFVCHYMMRVSSFGDPVPYISARLPGPESYLPGLSWATPPSTQLQGFGFTQLYFKSRETGQILKFPDHEKYAIADLRTAANQYEWMVLKVRVFDLAFRLKLFGEASPEIVANLNESSYLVLAPDFVINKENPPPGNNTRASADGLLGSYGFGYAFIRSPTSGFTRYGPGDFEAAFESIRFDVALDGRIMVRTCFVANRPERATAIDVNPAAWSLRIADVLSFGMLGRAAPNLMKDLEGYSLGTVDPLFDYIGIASLLTGGQSRDMMGISRDQLDKRFLLQNFSLHYQTIIAALVTWRQVRNWLDPDSIPKWVKTGGLIND